MSFLTYCKRGFQGVIIASIIALAAFITDKNAPQPAHIKDISGIPKVGDGDSVVLSHQKMRFKGIDAPEYRQKCKIGSSSYSCGLKSRDYLINLIGKKTISCKGIEKDQYERLLVTCFVGNINLNREMVLAGWAVSYGNYHTEQMKAQSEKRGLWQGEFQQPSLWRKENNISKNR